MKYLRTNSHPSNGFTLIEMIVALGVFSFVITISVGALLSIIATNQRLQAEQSVMTNLAFALDSMTREIRTGYNYVCASANNDQQPVSGLTPAISPPPKIFASNNNEQENLSNSTKDCPDGRQGANFHGISFFEGGDSLTGSGATRIMYFYDAGDQTIKRRIGNGDAQAIISSAIDVIDADFIVHGTVPLSLGTESPPLQPTVTIMVHAREANNPAGEPFFVQTSVLQRALDI